MDMLAALATGFDVSLTPVNLFYCFVGVFVGTAIGVLPGLGPTATVAVLLPLTFSLHPATALIMLSGIYYGAQYGGSTTAILINLPGEASSAVTAIDGYQMALKGRGGAALFIAALGSFVAGCIATLLIGVAAQPLAKFALRFSSPEYFSLMILGLVCSVALAHGSVLKALGMVCLGVFLGLVGADVNSGDQRFTFGIIDLYDGISFIALAGGIFGLSEILRILARPGEAAGAARNAGSLMPTRQELRDSTWPILRGTFIGSILGILPGGGSVLGSFVSYSVEKKIARRPETFGHGAIAGVAGPESANNAGAQTSFIPMLTLGLPTNPIMALMIGALIVHGVNPGPALIKDHPELFWGVIASMFVGNVMLVALNIPMIGFWVKLASIPYRLLYPAIAVFLWIGIYGVNRSSMEMYELLLFGVGGYFLINWGCEVAPMLLGFVLGPLIDEHLRRAMLASFGDPMVFLERPISATFLALAAIALIIVAVPSISRQRKAVFSE